MKLFVAKIIGYLFVLFLFSCTDQQPVQPVVITAGNVCNDFQNPIKIQPPPLIVPLRSFNIVRWVNDRKIWFSIPDYLQMVYGDKVIDYTVEVLDKDLRITVRTR
jgi:hypothetical protein